MCRLLPGEGQEIADKLGGAIAFAGDLFQIGPQLAAQFAAAQNQFQVSFDDRQRVVQFVGHARNHLAQCGELFRLTKLLFQSRPIGQFAQEELVGRPAFKADRRAMRLCRRDAAVAPDEGEVAMPTDGGKPLRPRLRPGLRLRVDLAKAGQQIRVRAGDTQQTFGGLIQLQNLQVLRLGDDDAFTSLVEQAPVAFLS